MEQKEHIEYWLENARSDIDAAKAMQKDKHHLYVAFMCQQCIEKALKAHYIHARDDKHPFSHNLIQLAELSEIKKRMNEEQIQLLRTLNPYYINARYADYKNKLRDLLSDSYCLELIKETEELFSWIEQLMK